eukprot:SAG31_NODE_722_length_12572_cov_2.409124_4_plen_225_part_00
MQMQGHRLKKQAIQQIVTPLISTMNQFAILIAYWKGGQQVINKSFQVSDLVAFVSESSATISTMKTLVSTVTRTSRGRTENRASNRTNSAFIDLAWPLCVDLYHPVNGPMMLARFVSVKPSIGLSSPTDWTPPNYEKGQALNWDIEFRGVHFYYPADKDAKEVLGGPDGLNLSLPAGESIGICGRTGCGKSTLLRLLERLYDVQKGSILVGGRDIKSIEPRWLR